MKFRTYLISVAVVAILLFAFIAIVLVSAIGWPAASGLLILVALALLAGFGLTYVWVRRAVDEFGGTPMPGILGVMGADIEPDEPSSTRRLDLDLDDPSPPELPPRLNPDDDRVALSPPARSPICARCGARTSEPGSMFCRVCGAELPVAPGAAPGSGTLVFRTCPKCGAATFGSDSRYCVQCGVSIESVPPAEPTLSQVPVGGAHRGCPRCGAISDGAGARFCRKCGQALG